MTEENLNLIVPPVAEAPETTVALIRYNFIQEIRNSKPNKLTEFIGIFHVPEFYLLYGALGLILATKFSWFFAIPIVIFLYTIWVSGYKVIWFNLLILQFKTMFGSEPNLD
jgi:hypothetical protein